MKGYHEVSPIVVRPRRGMPRDPLRQRGASGNFLQTFSGNVNFRYFGVGSALPMTAEVVMSLSLISLLEGNVDFYNTASISMDLPPGFSATTSSGLPLVFAPVPEPGTYAMVLTGLGLLGFAARRRKPTLIRQ